MLMEVTETYTYTAKEIAMAKKKANVKRKIKPDASQTKIAELQNIESEFSEEVERVQRRLARKARALANEVDIRTQMDHETATKAMERLQARGLMKPEYETGSAKMQIRLPLQWKAALLQEAKRRGIPQSELIREGIKKVLPREVAKELPDIYVGRHLN